MFLPGRLGLPGLVTTTSTPSTQSSAQFTSTAQGPVQFKFAVLPPVVHVSPGVSNNVMVYIGRSPGFSGTVVIDLLNPPNWVAYRPLTLDAPSTNGTLIVAATPNAPKMMATLTVRASSPGSAEQTTTLDIRAVGVTKVTSPNGTAVVYETTKILDSETLRVLTSYSSDTGDVAFSKMTSQLQSLERGDVISAPPRASQVLPHGFLRMVLSVQQEGGPVTLQTRQAGILDAFQQLDVKGIIGAPSPAGSSSSSGLGAASRESFGPDGTEISFGPYNLGGTVVAQGAFKFSWGIPWHASIDCDYIVDGCDVDFYVHVGFLQEFQLSLTGGAGSVLNWLQDIDTLTDTCIVIVPGILWIEVKLILQGLASGNLNQDVNFSFYESWGFEVGPSYDDGWSLYKRWDLYPPTVEKSGTVGRGSGSDAKLGIGVKLDGSVDGIAGVYVAGGIFAELDSDQSQKPTWWVDGGVDVGVGVYVDVDVFSTSYGGGPWTLLRFRMIDGENFPPEVIITQPIGKLMVDLSTASWPQFTATATDFEDGDLCAKPSSVVWTSDVDGKLGTGCSIGGAQTPVIFKTAGDQQITVTATDSDGASISASTTVTVKLPIPQVFITKPSSNDQFYKDAEVTLEGHAGVGTPLQWLTCDRLVFSIQLTGIQEGHYQEFHPSTSTQQYCEVHVAFDTVGTWKITLTAKSNAGLWGSAITDVYVVAPPVNEPPKTEIDTPKPGELFPYKSMNVPLEGKVSDKEGEAITYTWYTLYTYIVTDSRNYIVPVVTTISTGNFSHSQCTPGAECHVSAQFSTDDYCNVKTFTGDLTVGLEASEPVRQGAEPRKDHREVTIKLLCQPILKSPGTPIFGLMWAFSGFMLTDRDRKPWLDLRSKILQNLHTTRKKWD